MTFKEELISILEEELESVKAIKELTFEKTDVIINNKVEKLGQMTKMENELINKMGLAEEKRLKMLDTWGVGKNTPLSEIVEKIPEGKEELIKIGEELTQLLADIQSRNNTNSELIDDNLQWLGFNMNLFTEGHTPSTYGSKNNDKNKNKVNNNLFDRKV